MKKMIRKTPQCQRSELENPKKQNPLPAAKFQPEISEVVNYLNDVVGPKLRPGSKSEQDTFVEDWKMGQLLMKWKAWSILKPVNGLKAKRWSTTLDQRLCSPNLILTSIWLKFRTSRKKIEANRRLKKVVDGFVQQQNLVFSWDVSELESLEKNSCKIERIDERTGRPHDHGTPGSCVASNADPNG